MASEYGCTATPSGGCSWLVGCWLGWLVVVAVVGGIFFGRYDLLTFSN
jgi:hypothetical protein